MILWRNGKDYYIVITEMVFYLLFELGSRGMDDGICNSQNRIFKSISWTCGI